MLKTLHHPHIVPYLDHFWDDADQALYLVMAFCDCGDLLGLIERTQAKSASSDKRAVRGASPPSHHPRSLLPSCPSWGGAQRTLPRPLSRWSAVATV